MGLLALHVDHEAETAGVVLELRVVKALLRRQSARFSLRWVLRLHFDISHLNFKLAPRLQQIRVCFTESGGSRNNLLRFLRLILP